MRLDQMIGDIDVVAVHGDPSTCEVSSVTHDSRKATAGSLFCCIPGQQVDGHDFAAGAVERGAAALVCNRRLSVQVPQVVVAETRPVMARLAASFHGHPSRRLSVVGVTGTNGKTTTTYLLRAVLESAGSPTEVIGTLSGARTTPEADELQARFAELVDGGTQAVAMEVSSHALAQHRVDATWFSVAVFTNLSQEHLDFHGTMEDYFRTKASLFAPDRAAAAVVNADDPYGQLLLRAARIPTRPFSLADAAGLEMSKATGTTTFRWEGEPVHLRLGGRFNVLNALAAAAAARELGVEPAVVATGLSSVTGVPGRFEVIDEGQPFAVVVDYAHTPAGLEQALIAAREASEDGRVIVVFGCGGDRDPSKRPEMGEVATRFADLAVLTNDNPRSEDPAAIADDVIQGTRGRENLAVELDRRQAIARAISEARPGDTVVVAGKGHEPVQIIGDQRLPFDDRQVAREELARRSA